MTLFLITIWWRHVGISIKHFNAKKGKSWIVNWTIKHLHCIFIIRSCLKISFLVKWLQWIPSKFFWPLRYRIVYIMKFIKTTKELLLHDVMHLKKDIDGFSKLLTKKQTTKKKMAKENRRSITKWTIFWSRSFYGT